MTFKVIESNHVIVVLIFTYNNSCVQTFFFKTKQRCDK